MIPDHGLLDALLGGTHTCEVLVAGKPCGQPMTKVEVWRSSGGRTTRVRVCRIHRTAPR